MLWFTKHKSDLVWSTAPTFGPRLPNTSYFYLTPCKKGLVVLSINPVSQIVWNSVISVFCSVCSWECSEELFEMIPPSPFYHRTSRHRCKAHLYYQEPPGSSTATTHNRVQLRMRVRLPTKGDEKRINYNNKK